LERFAGGSVLAPSLEMAFQHDPAETSIPLGDLLAESGGNARLILRVLVAVGVAAVDHDTPIEAGFLDTGKSVVDVFFVEVGTTTAAAEKQMTVLVAAGADDGGESLFGHREEVMGVRG